MTMRGRRVVQIGAVLFLLTLVAGVALGIWLHGARQRYQQLVEFGAIAQRDGWGRVTQINLWPSRMDPAQLEVLGRLDQLQLLNLSATEFSDDEVEFVARIESLEELILNQTRLTDAGLVRLAGLKNLRRINLAPSGVTRSGVDQLKQTRPDLDIAVNPLVLHGLGHFVLMGGHGELDDHYHLVALDLHDSPVTDEEMQPVLKLAGEPYERLRMVNLSGTGIGDAGLECLRNLVGVRELWLTGTDITDEGLKTVAGFRQLQSISLARTGVSDTGIAQLATLEQLEVLHLGETKVSDRGLHALRGLQQLKQVYATASSVTTDGAAELAEAIPAVQVYGGAEPEKPVEEIESRVLG